MKKTFNISDKLNVLTDTRVNQPYTTAKGIIPVLLGFLLRIQSLNELKYRMKSKDFKGILSTKIKLPQIDTIREVLKKIDLTGLRDITASVSIPIIPLKKITFQLSKRKKKDWEN